jgi:peptide/nickel transport system substrate-binding protein
MRPHARLANILALVLIALLVGCQQAPASSGGSRSGSADGPSRSTPKRVVAAIMGDPPHFQERWNPSIGSTPGLDTLIDVMNAGMAVFSNEGVLRPQLAEQVPSIDNGLWKVSPDGRMELTWKIKQGAVWHDGIPVTADDLVFTAMMGNDREIPGFVNEIHGKIDSTSAPDPRTFVAVFNSPFIAADTLFTQARGLPLPKHILEAPYRDNHDAFKDHLYFSEQFVGTGAFKLRELSRGSHVILEANDKYVLGRPNVDILEVKFTPDANTLITTLLAGSADMTMGARLSIDQALQIQNSWSDGSVIFVAGGWVITMPQFMNPTPTLLLDVRLRRALQHSINRQVIVDELLYGKTEVNDAPMAPSEQGFKDVQSAIVRYPYDTERAGQLFSELGYRRGPDGMLRDAAGQTLNIENRTNNQLDTQVKAAAIVSSFWKEAGVNVDEIVYGQQRVADREYRHTRPGFETLGFGLPAESFALYHTKQIPRPESGFLGQNRTRYSNPEYDALLDKYYVTIPMPERIEVLRQIIHHFTDQLVVLPFAYTTNHVALSKKLKNVTGRGANNTEGWNAEKWESTQ